MRLGILCGTSLLDSDRFSDLPLQTVETERGTVQVREGNEYVVLQRHASEEGYTPPHLIDHRSHILALVELGVERVFSVQSCGSLTNRIPPGTFAVPHDFFNPWQTHTFYSDDRGHRAISFDNTLRKHIREVLKEKNMHFTEDAVYVQTRGPRFETPAEAQFLAEFGDVVGMTAAAEVILAGEKDLPYATLCSVDNFVNGIEDTSIDIDSFRDRVQQHVPKVVRAVEGVIERLTV